MTSAKNTVFDQNQEPEKSIEQTTKSSKSDEDTQELCALAATNPANSATDIDCADIPDEAKQLLSQIESRPTNDVMDIEALRLVRILWPKAFNVSSPRPLKIGIHKDMEATNFLPNNIISIAMRFFTSMGRYLENIKPGTARINLQGEPTGRVRLREAVDAEIKVFTNSSDFVPNRDRVIIKKISLLSVTKN